MGTNTLYFKEIKSLKMKNIKHIILIMILIFSMHNISNAQNCSVNANIDFTLCANEPLLLIGQKAGLFYGNGTTTWSQISGPTLNILSPNALTTAVTGHVGNTVYKFRITTKCMDGTLTYDDVTYTVKPITQSNAGPDQVLCPGSPAGLMAGNSVAVNETGSWLVTGSNNGVTVSNSLSPTSSFNLDATKSGITKMVWTINNTNGCLSRDTMQITNRGGVNPVNAGIDKILTNCYSSTQTTSMTATFGGSGIDGQTGIWTLLSGPSIATIVNPNSNTTNVTGLIEGTYKLLWTVSGPCANGADTVQIIVPPATSSVSSVSITSIPAFCDGRTSTVLTANAPQYINETGIWTKVSGPAGDVIVSPNSNITSITGLNGTNSYTYRYTITNSLTGCSASNTTNISYSPTALIDITPVQTILPCGQTFAVIPYTTSGGGTVQWSIVSGPKTPTYPTIPTNYANASGSPLTINGLTVSGTYVIRLKKSSGIGPSCNTSYDDVTVVVSANPTGSNSGTKQILACNITQTALAGNLPYVGIGTWTQVSGPNIATIDSVNKFDSQIKNMISGTYKFRWLIAGGPYCSTQQSDVTIVVVSANPSQANAGPDVSSCANTPLYLNGNNPLLNETGTWSVIPSAGISFSDINSPNAIVNGLAPNTTYKFIWKMQNACSFNTDTMTVTTNNITGPVQANAGPDQCKTAGTTSLSLSANNPGAGNTGTWTKISGGSANITNPNQHNTTVTGLSNGTYLFEWSILSNGACNPTRDTVMITISNPATTANAGSDQQICGNSVNLSANNPTIGIGLWTQLTGNGGAVISDSSIANTSVNGLTNGVYNFLWTISNDACPSNSDTVKIYVTNPPTVPDAGTDISVCGYDTVSLNANNITTGNGSWSFVSGPNPPSFANSANPKTKVSGMITGNYVFRWSSYNGPFCPASYDDVNVNVILPANAGSDLSYCDGITSVNLSGTTSSTGTWTQITGPNISTINQTSSNTATASNLITGSYTFSYSINAPGCSSTDDMTVNLYAPPSVANAGIDISYCNEDTIMLSGNIPVFGTATWSKLSGPSGGSFKPNANSPNAIFTASTAGTYVFVYKISNFTCSNSDQVIVKNFAAPSSANAGFDQTSICTNSTLMSANLPSSGIGNWTLLNGPNIPNIVSPILPNTTINNLIPGIYNFEWSISSGICPVKYDTVQLIVNQPPTTANAGTDKILCNTSSLNLEGNSPLTGTGKWTQFSGPNTIVFADSTNPNTLISNIVNGTYIFNWTTSLSPCSSTDQVIVTNYQNPTTADAGSDINNCMFTPLSLNANSPTIGTGQWSQLTGPITTNILSPNAPNTYILGTIPGNYSYIWTVNNGICNSSKDTVNVVVSDIPTMAIAGSDQSLCNVTTFNLSGNTPIQGTGTWIQNSGPIVNINSINNPTSNVTAIIPGIYNFTWQTTNNFCTSSDNVNFTVYGQPIANAGNNQDYCNSNTFTMSANTPAYGSGNWTKISGPSATITNPASPTTTITGVTTGTYIFRWTVSNGNCTPAYSDVTIINYATPTIANAGSNQSICATTATMTANTAAVGTGTWTQESGPNTATITDASLNNTTITGLIQGTYIFKWSISNGSCSPSSSLVTINVSENPTIANAGANQILCNVTSLSLNGNNPSIGNGIWTLVNGPNTPVFVNNNLYNTDVNGLINGTYTFKWSISNGVCPVSESQVTIANNQLPSIADAGANQNLCNVSSTILDANIPTTGTGEWTVISGPNVPSITNSNLNNTSINNLIYGTYVFRWTISNANCPPSFDEVTINNSAIPTIANAGSNQSFCKSQTTTNLAANSALIGNGEWSQISGPNTANFGNINSPTTNITNLVMGTYQFKWTISNGSCTPSSSDVTVQLINCIPIAINDTNSTPENTAVSGNILPNDSDPDNDPLTVSSFIIGGISYPSGSLVNIPGIGTIIINSDGSYTFTPAMHWSGIVPNIPYTISDGFGGNATAELIITVTPVPHYIDLGVTKQLTDPNPLLNDTIRKNDTVTFTITLKNNSAIFNATNIVVLDTLPTGMNYVSSTASSGNYDHITGLWTLANLNSLDVATLNISVKIDTSSENYVYIIGHNNPDSNLYNNKDFASVSVSNTSSGNDGGLESNGNLASKVGLRNFIRHKERNDIYNQPEKLELFSPASIVSAKAKNTQTTDLTNLIPISTFNNLPALVTTPIDLIGISNAIEVVAVDYFNQSERKAAILGIASNAGTVYEHTKMVCDRLDGGSLNNISYKAINGYPFLLANIAQDNSNIDYAISFIAYKSGNTYYIDSKWDLEDYNPSGNHAVLNFQVWSINENQTLYLVGKILENIQALGYNIVYKNNAYNKFPEVYVKSGSYKDGNLELNLVNTDAASAITLNGNKAIVEDGLRFPFNYSSPISTAHNSSITIPTGNIFDIGFTMSNNVSQANDVLYFADGPWGREFDATGATISDFSISSQFNPPLSGAFNLGRNANLEGTVKTYASLYRVLRVGNKTVNLTNYDKLEFTALGSGNFDVIISKAGITSWADQYKTTINLDYNIPTTFKIPVSQFVNAQGQHNLSLEDAVSVVFVKKGNNSTYQNFTIDVSDMRFINDFSGIDPKAVINNKIDIYPNPFSYKSTVSFNLKKNENVKIGLYSLEGKLIKIVADKEFGTGINNVNINADELSSGIYMIKVETNSFNSYEKIIISK